MKYRDLVKRLRDMGCEEITGGKSSHRKWHNPATGSVAVLRELEISREDFGPIK